MVTTLITAIGVFAVRNISKVDQAVGYSRQGTQTLAVAELGATAAIAQIAALGAQFYADEMDKGGTCAANGNFTGQTTCYRVREDEIQGTTGTTLFKPSVAGGDTGSFGPVAGTMGHVSVEMTEKYQASFPVPGARVGEGSYVNVTMTATGHVRPAGAGTDECKGTALATTKKVMRAHTVIGPLLSQSPP